MDAAALAHTDQVTQPAVDLARIFAAFHTTLREAGIPASLAKELTLLMAASEFCCEDEDES